MGSIYSENANEPQIVLCLMLENSNQQLHKTTPRRMSKNQSSRVWGQLPEFFVCFIFVDSK